MSSETEDSVNAGEDSHNTEMNGDAPSPTENGNNKENVTEDVIVEEKSGGNDSSNRETAVDKLPKEVGPSDDSSDEVSNSQSKNKVDADDSVLVEDDDVEELTNETNGDDKEHLDDVGSGGNGKKGTGQRRMSLRPRSTPKKYVDVEESSDDDSKDPLATKDPLAIPLGKNSSTVLIRKSSSPTASVSVKPVVKPPLKISKVTRPPPELIKAPPLHKLSVSPATTVTVVPRSKENANPGFVIVDTQSILTGKGPVAVNTVPASVTVSAVPSVQVTSKQPPKATPITPASASLTSHKKTVSSNATSHSLPDPFEALGLADDSFIVEAPSFVVPYLIEKTAPQNLRKHIDTMVKGKDGKTPAEDVIVLSEDDSDDSGKNEKKDKDKNKEKEKDQENTDKSAMDKSSMKSEMEKSQTQTQTKTGATKERDDYFTGPIGRFFLDIGLSLVQEYVQGDLLRVQKRKASKGSKISDPSLTVSALSKGLDITRAKNDPYRLPLRQCDRCNFKSESRLVMAQHWSTPFPIGYGSAARFGCHWCPFETKESHLVAAHIEAEHDLKSRASVDRLMHQCPLCPFEDNIKSKVTRHVLSCQKRYVPERNQEPPLDWEPPAKIPRIPPRNVRNFGAGGAAGLAAAVASAAGINPSSLASYQMAASAKGNAAFALPSYHPLLPKSALLNSLGYSVLPTAGQLAYLSNLTSTLQGKGGKGASAAAAAAAVAAQTLAGLRLPAELHVVQGAAQQRSNTPPQSAQSKTGSTGANYRQSSQSGQSTSSLFLPSSYSVQSNQIYQQLLHGQGTAAMSVLPASASKGLAVGGSKKNVTGSSSSSSSVTLVPGLVSTSGLTIQSSSTPAPAANKTRSNQQPSISITPLPRSTTTSASNTPAAAPAAASNKPSLSVSPVTPATASAGNAATPLAAKPGQPTTAGQKGSAVCEICDGYIKDLEQLRHHMQWIHKVKIHPKMIHNRPPLNCQKCQCRFFTDQGLERHLLGSHGLVTSSMQEAANRGQDGGRCPICGKVHQWKLLSHVVKDHGLSLKPAHLSYKCTVCTATFTMYKLFENHVYTAHSVVARKVLDKDKEKDKDKKPGSGSTNNSTSGLRINDEITIIPQPARHDTSSSSDQQHVCRSCHSSYDPVEVKRQLRRLDVSASNIPGSDQKCASCLRLSSITKGEKRSRVDVIDLSDDEDHHHHQDGGSIMLPKSQVTITKVPAPKGYNSRNNKESSSTSVVVKRSRMDDHDTD